MTTVSHGKIYFFPGAWSTVPLQWISDTYYNQEVPLCAYENAFGP